MICSRFALLVAFLLAIARTPEAIAAPQSVSVAAAANLVYALDALNAEYRRATPTAIVTVTVSASGTLFAQIKQGAPFDVFLSADTDYPRQIVAAKLGDA